MANHESHHSQKDAGTSATFPETFHIRLPLVELNPGLMVLGFVP